MNTLEETYNKCLPLQDAETHHNLQSMFLKDIVNIWTVLTDTKLLNIERVAMYLKSGTVSCDQASYIIWSKVLTCKL